MLLCSELWWSNSVRFCDVFFACCKLLFNPYPYRSFWVKSWSVKWNLSFTIPLEFWIVSWGIIMNYVVGPSIQKWVHFTGSKAAILHISFLSLKPAKTFSSDITLSVLIHIFWSWTVKCINIICIFSQWPWIMFFSVEREKHCLN